MMRGFLATWIVFQLLVIGWAHGESFNMFARGEVDCNIKPIEHSLLQNIIIPLTAFLPDQGLEKYCNPELTTN